MSFEKITAVKESIQFVLDKLSQVEQSYECKFVAGSQAETEWNNTRDKSLYDCIGAILQLLRENAGEHLHSLTKNLSNPVESLVYFTTIRSMLETCAIGKWLVSREVTGHERLGRCLAYRYGRIVEQSKYLACIGGNREECEKDLDAFEKRATRLGFLTVRNKKKKRISVHCQTPVATDNIKKELGVEAEYRLLSGLAHADISTMQFLGYKKTQTSGTCQIGGVQAYEIEKAINPKMIWSLGVTAILSHMKFEWERAEYFGWDMCQLNGHAETVADKLSINERLCFWRSNAS